jgi:hypothetical protein
METASIESTTSVDEVEVPTVSVPLKRHRQPVGQMVRHKG